MKDRVPLYPGRVKLTPVSGQENTYDMVRSDEPTQEGTPLNKATLLKDATAALYGLPNTAVPDDVLSVLSRFQNGLGNEYVWERTREGTVLGYVNSPDPNAYPPAVPDGYTYTALGQLGAKVQIETGSYTGTGTYGASNPNSLTFNFAPKLVFIVGTASKSNYFCSDAWIRGAYYGYLSLNTSTKNKLTWSGNTLSWYLDNEYSPAAQLNAATTYNYIAIG